MNLREYRTEPTRLADLLPWAGLVAPGVILNKDGSVQKTLAFRGPDVDAAPAAEQVVCMARLNALLKRLGSGWVLHAEAQRQPTPSYPDATWPDPISLLVDEERRAAFSSAETHFETQQYLTFQYLLPDETQTRLRRWLYEQPQADERLDYWDAVRYFEAQVARLHDLLTDMVPEIVPLDDAATLTYLHSTISTKMHAVAVPGVPFYLDTQLTDVGFQGGLQPRLGEWYLGTVGIKSWPEDTVPFVLDELNRLPVAYRYVVRYVYIDKAAALRQIRSITRKWFAKRQGLLALCREALTHTASPMEDPDAINKAAEGQAAGEAVAADRVGYGYLTATVTVWDHERSRVAEKVQLVERVINGRGFVAVAETLNAVEAYLGSLPGNTLANVRRPPLSTLTLAHLLPFSALWAGPVRNSHLAGPPLLQAHTSGATPFRLSLHDGDVGHTLIIGPTGMGKTVLLNLLALQSRRYPMAQVYIFDKKRGARATTLAVGGDHYHLRGGQAALAFQPLADIDDARERAWAAEWVEELVSREGVGVTPSGRDELWQALTNLAGAPPAHRTLTGLQHTLQDTTLRQARQPYTIGGPHGAVLDAEASRLGYSPWMCFELDDLLATPRIVPPVLSLLFHQLERTCFVTGHPTLLILDEAWRYFDHPLFAEKIREWLKELRKANVSVIFATQNVADALESPIAPALSECVTRIFLPNPRALEPEMSALYRRYGLNERQMQTLATATPKRQYYYTSRLGTRLFELGLGPVALAVCGATSIAEQPLLDALCEEAPAAFLPAFLRRKELAWAADLVAPAAPPSPSSPSSIDDSLGLPNEEEWPWLSIAGW